MCASEVAHAEGRPEASARHALDALDAVQQAERSEHDDLNKALIALFSSGLCGPRPSSTPSPVPSHSPTASELSIDGVFSHSLSFVSSRS